MDKTVLVMGGEGIGPEIVREGSKVLEAAARRFDLQLTLVSFEVGLPAIARAGKPLPDDAAEACRELSRRRGAILFGAVSDEPIGILRKELDLFANLRPVRAVPALLDISPLVRERVAGVDLLIVRELVSGIYYGEAREGRDARGRWASQQAFYAEPEVRRIVRVGLEQARRRRQRLTLVHKGNVIKGVFGLWQDVLRDEAKRYPDVLIDALLVDNMALQMLLRPAEFDVLLCSNLFGDILSDLGGGLLGSIGLLPSASLNEAGFGLYESVGGTAPDIAGQNRANPVSTLLSAALLLRHSFEHERAARHVERAVYRALETHRTADVWAPGTEKVSCSQLGDVVARLVLEEAEAQP